MRILLVLTFLALSHQVAFAQQSNCPRGEGAFDGSPCMPAKMINFLYCVQRLGNGRVEVTTKTSQSKSSNMEVGVTGGGSGLVLKLEGGVTYKKGDADQAINEATEKLDSKLAGYCKDLAQTSEAVDQRKAEAFSVPSSPRYAGKMGPLEPGISYNQGDIYDTPSNSAEQCSSQCYNDNRCIAVTWIESQKRCWIKGSFTGNIGRSSDMTSARRLITR